MSKQPSILLIYTGGTIGMIQDPASNSLRPINFEHIHKHLPEINNLGVNLKAISFEEPIDSSNMNIKVWNKLAMLIKEHYNQVDGIVVLHGSDTMSYTASALSFMLEGLDKPVILTGSQLPIGVMRTDGKENLITSIEIAAQKINGQARIKEVCVYFEYQLYRGNRTHKYSAQHFEAFISPNYPVLASAGVEIAYNDYALLQSEAKDLTVRNYQASEIAVLVLFPGISEAYINAVLNVPDIKGVIVYSFGAGNIPNIKAISDKLEQLAAKQVLLLNVTQCNVGKANRSTYKTNPNITSELVDALDMTLESSIAKMMYLLSVSSLSYEDRKKYLTQNLRGEITTA